jgi:hypothetical protein
VQQRGGVARQACTGLRRANALNYEWAGTFIARRGTKCVRVDKKCVHMSQCVCLYSRARFRGEEEGGIACAKGPEGGIACATGLKGGKRL